MLGPTFNLTAVLALIAAALLLASGQLHLHLDKDGGLVAATLLGGAGWFGRELYQDTRRRRAVCQAYAAVIETTLIGFRGTLNDTQLTRYLAMARAVQDKTEPPSIRGEVTDPATLLPDLRAESHLLAPETVRLATQWLERTRGLNEAYQFLGTAEFCAYGQDRLKTYLAWLAEYRREHEQISRRTLRALRRQDAAISIEPSLLRDPP